MHHIVLKNYLFDIVFALDRLVRTGVLCAPGGKKWSEVGFPE